MDEIRAAIENNDDLLEVVEFDDSVEARLVVNGGNCACLCGVSSGSGSGK